MGVFVLFVYSLYHTQTMIIYQAIVQTRLDTFGLLVIDYRGSILRHTFKHHTVFPFY